MGQYYKPAFVDEMGVNVDAWAYSHDYDNGLKLMEHSYLNNRLVNRIEHELYGVTKRVVWAGDYADPIGPDGPLYNRCEDDTKLPLINCERDEKYRYLINWDKKEYVDLDKVPEDSDGWKIHPLPLLTCEGNGRGGGDYRGSNTHVGRWSRDHISIECNALHLATLAEIQPDFVE